MESLDQRYNSFSIRKRVKSGPKSTKLLTWPHPDTFGANPETLSEAGFYFDPSTSDIDSVTCFMCAKQLSEWTAEDDPFDVHFQKCAKTCTWAFMRCGLKHDMDKHGRFKSTDKNRYPNSKAMEQARLDTFTSWKFDSDKNCTFSSKKMAQAGFIFNGKDESDDLATCLYCDVSLGGWEDGDDPLEEHRSRVKDHCAFISSLSKPLGRSTSKPPSRNTKTDLVMPTKTHDGADSENEKIHTKTPRASRTKGAKTPRRRTTQQEETVEEPPAPRTRKPSTRGKAKPVSETEEEPIVATVKKSKKQSKAKELLSKALVDGGQGKKKVIEAVETDDGTTTKSAKTRRRPTQQEEIVEEPPAPRTRKPSTRGKAKPVPETEEEPVVGSVKKSTKQSKAKEVLSKVLEGKQKVIEAVETDDGEDIFMDAMEEQPASRIAKSAETLVILSSDGEDVPPPRKAEGSRPRSNVGKLATKFEFPKRVTPPPRPPRSPARPKSPVRALATDEREQDVNMDDYVPQTPELDADQSMEFIEVETQPVTPPRAAAEMKLPSAMDLKVDGFIPALARTAFEALGTLSEAELAMTVEEWIRFHIGLECDRFGRDGEREVVRFEKRAQEVQMVLEGL